MNRRGFYGLIVLIFLVGCGQETASSKKIPVVNDEYVVFAWNDLGMHCLNPTYDTAVILPPYNDIWAQVIKRGEYPQIITTGLQVSYRLIGNTYSYGKTDNLGGRFSQFWDNISIFGLSTLEHDKGLNLRDPDQHNGLSGDMLAKDGFFVADGVPVVPVSDAGVWNPYQVAEITVKNAADGNTIIKTRAMVPTSDEINCSKCHDSSAFDNILEEHEEVGGQSLQSRKPVLCASCHGTPALGITGKGSSGKYLSEAIHGYHASKNAVCYDCHPGTQTKCSRSLAHTADDGNCTACHGNMANVASTIEGGRTPWVSEPACTKCHSTNIAQVNTGSTLYRNAEGHGNLYCAVCHGSPHAMIPTNQASDNYQAMQYQNSKKTIGSCAVCHKTSKGEGSAEFGEAHGGSSPENYNACHICHTAVPSNNTAGWPHAFQWTARAK